MDVLNYAKDASGVGQDWYKISHRKKLSFLNPKSNDHSPLLVKSVR